MGTDEEGCDGPDQKGKEKIPEARKRTEVHIPPADWKTWRAPCPYPGEPDPDREHRYRHGSEFTF